MFARILWRITTPRALRRRTLILLLAWLVVAVAYHGGHLGGGDRPADPLPVVAPAS